jgi:hypothetical protein
VMVDMSQHAQRNAMSSGTSNDRVTELPNYVQAFPEGLQQQRGRFVTRAAHACQPQHGECLHCRRRDIQLAEADTSRCHHLIRGPSEFTTVQRLLNGVR